MKEFFAAVGIIIVLMIVMAAFIYPWHCVAEGTLVDTPSGQRTVETLRVGDAVYSMTSDGRLAKGSIIAITASHAVRPLTIVTSGGTLVVTGTHPIATDSGWVDAGSLREGQIVLARSGRAAISAIESDVAWTRVYDLSIEPHPNFLANGILVHNKSPSRPRDTAIGQMRAVISAMQTYSSVNCGYFAATLSDLSAADGTPIPVSSWPADAPDFLGRDLVRSVPYTQSDYVRDFEAFDEVENVPPECVSGSVKRFCYTAHPIQAYRSWWVPRRGSFIADALGAERNPSYMAHSNGAIYVDREGRDMHCIDGEPPEYAQFLE